MNELKSGTIAIVGRSDWDDGVELSGIASGKRETLARDQVVAQDVTLLAAGDKEGVAAPSEGIESEIGAGDDGLRKAVFGEINHGAAAGKSRRS